jgi:hypothetical protein
LVSGCILDKESASPLNLNDSLVSNVDISAIDWHEEQNADPDIRRVKTLLQIGHKPTKKKTSFESEGVI